MRKAGNYWVVHKKMWAVHFWDGKNWSSGVSGEEERNYYEHIMDGSKQEPVLKDSPSCDCDDATSASN